MNVRTLVVFGLVCAASSVGAQVPALAPHQQLAHDIYKQLIEINTSYSTGATTPAAQAVADRLRAEGFPAWRSPVRLQSWNRTVLWTVVPGAIPVRCQVEHGFLHATRILGKQCTFWRTATWCPARCRTEWFSEI